MSIILVSPLGHARSKPPLPLGEGWGEGFYSSAPSPLNRNAVASNSPGSAQRHPGYAHPKTPANPERVVRLAGATGSLYARACQPLDNVQTSAHSMSPLRGFHSLIGYRLPWAYAHGYTLRPLRGRSLIQRSPSAIPLCQPSPREGRHRVAVGFNPRSAVPQRTKKAPKGRHRKTLHANPQHTSPIRLENGPLDVVERKR